MFKREKENVIIVIFGFVYGLFIQRYSNCRWVLFCQKCINFEIFHHIHNVARCGYSLCDCWWVSVRGSLSLFFVRNPHKRQAREISHETGKDERRKITELSRRNQSTEVDITGQSTEVSGSRQSREERRFLGPVDSVARLAIVREFLVALWEFRSNTRSR